MVNHAYIKKYVLFEIRMVRLHDDLWYCIWIKCKFMSSSVIQSELHQVLDIIASNLHHSTKKKVIRKANICLYCKYMFQNLSNFSTVFDSNTSSKHVLENYTVKSNSTSKINTCSRKIINQIIKNFFE